MSLSQSQAANEYIKKAEKAIKKSFFSSPDFSIGAQYYEQAANLFKSYQKYDMAKTQFLNSSECFVKTNSLFMAGKQTEAAASMALQLQQWDEAGDLFQKAAQLYAAHGSGDTACQVLENGAKHLESKDIERSIAMLTEATEIYHNDDRLRFSIDCYRKLTQCLMKLSKYDQLFSITPNFKTAARVLTNKNTLFQLYLTEMIIHLSMKDEIAGKKILDSVQNEPGFNNSLQAKFMGQLIVAYEEGDQEQFAQIVRANSNSFLDTETTRLATSIRVPGAAIKPPSAPSATTASDFPVPGHLPQQSVPQPEEEEDEDDLC